MDSLLRAADRFTGALGAVAKVVALISVLVCFATLYMRYALGITYIWLNESYIWANALAIALAAAYAYRDDALVRVDVLYERCSVKVRALIDIVGTFLFLAPFLYAVGFFSFPFVMMSYRMGESSPHPSGMPALYLLKGTILILAFCIAFQALISLARKWAILRGSVDTDAARRPE
tara:strand:- start:29 stop:556 length:528 start_codon:yes stop_codon:yes gene_type:complete